MEFHADIVNLVAGYLIAFTESRVLERVVVSLADVADLNRAAADIVELALGHRAIDTTTPQVQSGRTEPCKGTVAKLDAARVFHSHCRGHFEIFIINGG